MNRRYRVDAENPRPVGVFGVGTDRGFARTLEVWVGAACDVGETSCEILDGYPPIGLPISDEIDVEGVSWGYSQGRPDGGVAAVVGDYIVALEGVWFESRIPLLDEPDVVAFIEGLRVASPAELPEQFEVTDETGWLIDRTTGQPLDPSTGPASE